MNKSIAFVFAQVFILVFAAQIMAQDVTGSWQGMLNFGTGSINPDKIQYNWDTDKWTPAYSRYILEIEVNALNNNADDGFYNIMSGGSRGKMSIAITWDENRRVLKYSTKKNLASGYCMNDATLNYRVEDDYEYLEGTWKGCGMGKIALRRKVGAPAPVHAAAETTEYAELNGIGFSFPKNWKWEKEPEMVTVTSPDENIVLMVIQTSTSDINEAATIARKGFEAALKDIVLPEAFSESQRNGLTIQTIDGTAVVKDNDAYVFISSLLIQSEANQNFTIYLGIGEKSSILKNGSTIQAALDSFKPAN
ncbi:MAG: hypothetical protein MUC59_15905 [Saprospiraceae bacterium]|nr:hypothetical protein [Saprospiraceae bacterium]